MTDRWIDLDGHRIWWPGNAWLTDDRYVTRAIPSELAGELGNAPEEMVGQSAIPFMMRVTREGGASHNARLIDRLVERDRREGTQAEVVDSLITFARADGGDLVLPLRTTLITSPDGRHLGYFGVIRDLAPGLNLLDTFPSREEIERLDVDEVSDLIALAHGLAASAKQMLDHLTDYQQLLVDRLRALTEDATHRTAVVPDLVTIRQAAKLLVVSERTLRRIIEREQVATVDTGYAKLIPRSAFGRIRQRLNS